VTSRREKVLLIIGVLVVVWFVLDCLGFPLPGFDVLFFLVAGWGFFIHRVFPQVQIRWDAVISFVVYAVLLVVGSHLFLGWLYRQTGEGEAAVARRWQWRWTLSGFCLVVLMFAAGIAMIGVVHQSTWLARSPVPIFFPSGSREVANRVKCASNLRQIGVAIDQYARDHDGKCPDDFADLLLNDDITAAVFVCPSAADIPASGRSQQEIARNLKKPGCCSYLYFAKGVRAPWEPTRVLATEPLENHGEDGINVLYGDGHVGWVGRKEAEELLRKLGVGGAATQPTQPEVQ